MEFQPKTFFVASNNALRRKRKLPDALPVIFSPEAELHLAELQKYLAKRFTTRNATQYVQRIAEKCIALGAAPY